MLLPMSLTHHYMFHNLFFYGFLSIYQRAVIHQTAHHYHQLNQTVPRLTISIQNQTHSQMAAVRATGIVVCIFLKNEKNERDTKITHLTSNN